MRAGRGGRGPETGAVAIMVAVSMTMIMIAVALVLDFGIVRLDRQTNKAAADAAVIEGIRAVEGNDGNAKPWRGVCQALTYLRVNDNGKYDDLTGTWKKGDGTSVTGDPCVSTHELHNADCVPGTPSSWAWYSGTAGGGRIALDVKSGYRVSDGGFPEEAVLTGDSGDPAEDGCDQLAVIIQESRTPGLGSLAVDGDIVSRIRSVARTTPGDDGDAAVALLLLEQHDCLVVDIQGSSGASVLVRGAGERPGMIHSDSLGDGDLCSGTDKIIDGDFGSPPRIWAEDAESGTPLSPGIIGIRALNGDAGAVPGNAHDSSPDLVFAEGQAGGAPIGRGLVTRAPVDRRYRQPVLTTVAGASGLWNMTAAEALTAGYLVLGCTPPGSSTTATRVFVDCPGGISFSSSFAFSGEDATVVFNGPVKVEGSEATTLKFTDARKVYIKGSASAEGLRVTRSFQVNTGSEATCAERSTTDPFSRTQLVIGDGPLVAQGNAAVQMCQTAVVMADDDGTCAIPTTNGLAPYDNTCAGYVDIRGGGGLDWSAPNAVDVGPTAADFTELEDLALWTETSGNAVSNVINRVEGGGVLAMSGVFFLPNASPFRIAGQGGQDIGENAQFVARRLEVAGNGHLNMRPDPDDIVTISYWGDSSLVR